MFNTVLLYYAVICLYEL